MKMIRPEQLAHLRSTYPRGTRVELVQMDDAQAPPMGTHGTVTGVDDTGSLLVDWDNGSGLNVIWGVDVVRKVVVANNHIDTLALCIGDFINRLNTAVEGYEKGETAVRGPVNALVRDSISFVITVRNIEINS